MFVSDCININKRGHLTIGGVDTTELAAEFGTPLYVMDEDSIRKNCRKFVGSINENYFGNGLVLYASKAMCCKQMCRICAEEGMGLDVVSGGELYTALSVDFPADKIYFHGNNKSKSELQMAVDSGVGRIVVDNYTELQTLEDISAKRGVPTAIMLRVKPGVEAHTHEFIKTGQVDSKFGFALETGEAMEAVKEAMRNESLELVGIHCHIGSQIFETEPFAHAAETMVQFLADIKKETGFELRELNLGGGFGIKYSKNDNPPDFSEYMGRISATVVKKSASLGIKTPFILIEPGRSIVGAEGLTLYTVGAVKKIPDIRTYVSVDGGMFDNPRYILYGSEYEMLCANKANEPRGSTVTVAGKCCESGDLIGEGVRLQNVVPGDTLAVLSTGAYNFSMASAYNRNGRPPVVMVSGGKARVVVKGDSYDDIIMNDI